MESVPLFSTSKVYMTGDGIPLTPMEYGNLLARLTRETPVTPDYYSRGGLVAEYEARAAGILGKEDAVLLPTGTMANVLALEVLAGGSGRVIVPLDSHLYRDSGDAAQCLAGLNLIPASGGLLEVQDVESILDRGVDEKVPVPCQAMLIESPVRRLHEAVYSLDRLEQLVAVVRRAGLRLHLDGARLFIWSVWSGMSPAELSAPFDTVYFSLYKYFNALSGAILAGPRDVVSKVRLWRRRNGGALPQQWPAALTAMHFMEGFLDRLDSARLKADEILAELDRHPKARVVRPEPGTNAFLFSWDGAGPDGAERFSRFLRERNIFPPDFTKDDHGFWLKINETWLNLDTGLIVAAFKEGLDIASHA